MLSGIQRTSNGVAAASSSAPAEETAVDSSSPPPAAPLSPSSPPAAEDELGSLEAMVANNTSEDVVDSSAALPADDPLLKALENLSKEEDIPNPADMYRTPPPIEEPTTAAPAPAPAPAPASGNERAKLC